MVLLYSILCPPPGVSWKRSEIFLRIQFIFCKSGNWANDKGWREIVEQYQNYALFTAVTCPDPQSPINGYIEVSEYTGEYVFGSVARYHCNPGYR